MTVIPNVAAAVETSDQVASHLHPVGSFDVDDHPIPTGLEEIWRFTPLKRLRRLQSDAPLDGHGYTVDVTSADEVTVETIRASDPVKGSSGYVPNERISARAWHAATETLSVRVAKEAVVDQPTVITLTGTGVGPASAGHAVITAEPFSKATVVLQFRGSATYADNVEIVVGDSAQLTVISIQDWAGDAVHHTHHHGLVKRDGVLRHLAVSFGGDLVRMNTSVEYEGPGGEVELLGLYFADAGQHLEHRLFVDHNAPKTKSNVDYKGALQGRGAHAVWIGDVLIRQVAEGIETYESNRNLVLTDGARADSVPNLEIETGEIAGAGHASTTGRFDDEQLFYLRSRGIDEAEARRLVVHGFFADIIRKIGIPAIEDKLMEAVEAELAVNIGTPESYRHEDADSLTRQPASLPHKVVDSVTQLVEKVGPMTLVRACALADLGAESAISVEVGDTDVAIVHSGGRYYAIADECSHAAIPLSEGDVGDGEIECYLHGSRFDLATGRPLSLPATQAVAVYRCHVRGDDLLVDVSAPLDAEADTDEIALQEAQES